MKNFLYTKLLSMGILLMAAFTLVGCMDEDERIGYDISGHWFGAMDMWYNGEKAQGSEIEFFSSGWHRDRGTGTEVDYYRLHAVTSYFNWQVRDRILYLTFDDPKLDCAIVDYRLTDDYFRGYIANPVTLENETYFNLRNYAHYWDSYGYGSYYDYYVKGQTRSDTDSTGYHGIRGIYLNQVEK